MLRTTPHAGPLAVAEDERRRAPEAAALDRVAAIWAEEKRRRGDGLFDGRVFSIARLEKGRIEGHFVPYSWFLAQLREPALYEALRVDMLAVSGLLECPDGVVFGLRARGSTQDAGLWELVPSGGLSPESRDAAGNPSCERQIAQELAEEVGLPWDSVARSQPFLLVEDPATRVTDVALHLRSELPGEAILARHAALGRQEYERLEIVPPARLEGYRRGRGERLAAVSHALLRHAGPFFAAHDGKAR